MFSYFQTFQEFRKLQKKKRFFIIKGRYLVIFKINLIQLYPTVQGPRQDIKRYPWCATR